MSILSELILEKMYLAFCQDKRNCPLYTGFRFKRMSLERGSSAVLQGERKENHDEHIRIPKRIAILSPEKKIKES